MKTKAAVLWGLNEKWQVEDVEVDPPKDSEVLVKLTASGLCHGRGQGLGQMCLLGTCSEYTVVPAASVVKVDDGTALDKAALVGCGVTTGYGSAVRTAEVKAGETVIVMGIGGIGINAVQGA